MRGTSLGEEIAELLAIEPRGLSCDALAARLQRRRTDVRFALVSDPRFRRYGCGRASRWISNATAVGPGTDKDLNLSHGAVVPATGLMNGQSAS